eukprot:GEMP01014821.1.p1 GENE.GEMP01014821.1~~GEMP01014821.1.p1  ORF type:complete len:638 (+),score=97.96 GEMP01014821.1:198-2111(+)
MASCLDGCLECCGCLDATSSLRKYIQRGARRLRGRSTEDNIAEALKTANVNDGDNQTIGIEALLLRQNANRDIQKFYDIDTEKKFGEGAYGQVFPATHKESGSIRAVKILRKEDAINWNLIVAELSALLRLDHPNVLKIHEFFENEVELFMVTEACYGGEITEIIREYKIDCPVDAVRTFSVINIFAQIVSAVHYCHLEGITHRDLKLQNCLFKSDEIGVVKVIDFGLAGFASKNRERKEKSFDVFMGTALYAAPEILQQTPYSQKVDNWSLGVILYILFTGVHPFRLSTETISQSQFFARVKNEEYFTGPLEHAAVPAPVRSIIDGLLQKSPDDRMLLEDILNNPVITMPYKTPSRPQLDLMELHTNLMTYSSLSKFEKAVMMVIAHGAHSRDLEELRKMFMQLDVNNSGRLDKDEMANGFHKITGATSYLTTEELDAVFDHINLSGTGEISYTEWLTVCVSRSLLQQEESIKKAFAFFDANQDGLISLSELTAQLGVEESDAIIARIGDGIDTLTFADFSTFVYQVAEKRNAAAWSQPLSMFAPTGFGMVSLATIEEEIQHRGTEMDSILTDRFSHDVSSPAAMVIEAKLSVTRTKELGAWKKISARASAVFDNRDRKDSPDMHDERDLFRKRTM